MPPDVLTEYVAGVVTMRIDCDKWERLREIEERERETLASIAAIGWEPGKAYHLTPEGG